MRHFFWIGLLSLLTLINVNKVRFSYPWEDAALRTLLAPLTSTVWADGYSEINFSKVKLGMSSTQVLSLLGKPLDGCRSGLPCAWAYTKQKSGPDAYDRRWIAFDKQGKVNQILRNFYVD